MSEVKSHRPVKSTERTLEILEHLASVGEPRTLGELARELELPKSSLHAILRTMQGKGWIQPDASGARFSLGVRALLVGTTFVETDDVVSLTADTLDDLANEIGETVHLGRLDGADIVYLAKRESKHPLRLFSAIGRRLPAHATALGKAVLSMQDPETVRQLLPEKLPALTVHTIVDHDELAKELAHTRERGYAFDDQENTEGIRCVAVPLCRNGVVRDAISCSVPTPRLSPQATDGIIEAIQRARVRAESRLGLRASSA